MFTGDNVGLILSIAAPCFLIYLVFHIGMVHDDFKNNGIRTVTKINNIKQISTSGTGSPKCVFTLFFYYARRSRDNSGKNTGCYCIRYNAS